MVPYEYVCSSCGYVADIEMGMMDDKPKDVECPHCHKNTFNRNYQAAIIVPFQWTKDQFRFDKRDRNLRKYK